jgi:hypothetical protein
MAGEEKYKPRFFSIYVVSIILSEKADIYKPRFCSFLVCEQGKKHISLPPMT